MPTINILPDTFSPATASADDLGNRKDLANYINGTVDVEIGHNTVTAWAEKTDTDIRVYGFVGRYKTSAKAWHATVKLTNQGALLVWFGRDDRSGNFTKQNGISWEPETYFA